MIKLTKEQIVDLASEMDIGMVCFVDLQENEIRSVIDLNLFPESDDEFWADDIKEINRDPKRYIKIEKPDSSYEFQLMSDFTEMVLEERLRNRLADALSGKKPFASFKNIIHNTSLERKDWFKFRSKRLEEFALTQIDILNKSLS